MLVINLGYARMTTTIAHSKTDAANRFTRQAEKLSLLPLGSQDERAAGSQAVEAQFITPQDPVIVTADGNRLPAVSLIEAQKLNKLKNETHFNKFDAESGETDILPGKEQKTADGSGALPQNDVLKDTELHHESSQQSSEPEAPLGTSVPSSRTNPLFPPLPLYGPPTLLRNLHCSIFRSTSFFLSLGFLAVIVLGSAFTSIPLMARHIAIRLSLKNPDARRPFHVEEVRRQKIRKETARAWTQRRWRRSSMTKAGDDEDLETPTNTEEYVPTEGGADPLICDVGYYARRVGLDIEEFQVQTEDGFIIELWHVYNPKEYAPAPQELRGRRRPEVFPHDQVKNGRAQGASGRQYKDGNRRYPVLLVHGLLQSSGAYCCNDDDSLAFFLCKRYDQNVSISSKEV